MCDVIDYPSFCLWISLAHSLKLFTAVGGTDKRANRWRAQLFGFLLNVSWHLRSLLNALLKRKILVISSWLSNHLHFLVLLHLLRPVLLLLPVNGSYSTPCQLRKLLVKLSLCFSICLRFLHYKVKLNLLLELLFFISYHWLALGIVISIEILLRGGLACRHLDGDTLWVLTLFLTRRLVLSFTYWKNLYILTILFLYRNHPTFLLFFWELRSKLKVRCFDTWFLLLLSHLFLMLFFPYNWNIFAPLKAPFTLCLLFKSLYFGSLLFDFRLLLLAMVPFIFLHF